MSTLPQKLIATVSRCVPAANAPSLKTQIRELYKRIHPDKFHGFPPARDANEKSFKMLQEYLAVGDHLMQCYTIVGTIFVNGARIRASAKSKPLAVVNLIRHTCSLNPNANPGWP